jgi:arylsulfatase A-like enzyme
VGFVARGALVGVAVMLLELVLVLRAQAVGLSIDVKGPFRALLDAVGGELVWLALRIVVSYACGFALLAMLARALQWALRVKSAWLIFVAEIALLVWWRAVRTPALFDDLPGAETWLTPVVNLGEPWHPLLVAGAVLAVALYRGRERGAIVLASIGIVWCWTLDWQREVKEKHPLVVMFGIDAMRPDRLGTGITPNLDRFVAESVSFTRAYTPIAATDAAWRSLLTARYPQDHGVRYSLTADELQDTKLDTFARAFTRAGWDTAFATDCSRFHFETEQSGFLTRHQPPRGAINFLYEKLRFRALPMLNLGVVPELTTNRALAGMYDAEDDARRVARDLITRAKVGPLLYAFHATAAHFPGDPQYPFYRQRVAADEPLGKRLRMHFQPIEQKARAHVDYQANAALYDELITQADMQLGVLLDALRKTGLYEQATIVVFSDHGEDFYDDLPDLRGELSVHGARLNAVESQIVLAVKTPSARAKTNDDLVRLIDVGQTLLDLAGLPVLPDTPGRSLAPLLRGESLPSALLLAETAFTHAAPDVFNPAHYTGALRSFEAYDLRKDGTVAVKPAVHSEIMLEKDFGVFDGTRWLIRWRDKSGLIHHRCTNEPCDANWATLLDGR